MARNDSVEELVDRVELPFNEYGVDPYGISKKHLVQASRLLAPLYRHYFRVKCYGIENIPRRGRGMLIGNHSGGIALDGAMVLMSTLLEMDPPRVSQSMVEKFLAKLPVFSSWTSRTGQFVGLPEHAVRLLEDDRLLLVFPEGARGTEKLYTERNTLVDFGTGFMRLVLQTKSPIIPFAVTGAGDAIPTITNLYSLAKVVGVPYLPVTPWGLPLPLPVRMTIDYGEPMRFQGTGREEDEIVAGYVQQVKDRVAELLDRGLRRRNQEEG